MSDIEQKKSGGVCAERGWGGALRLAGEKLRGGAAASARAAGDAARS